MLKLHENDNVAVAIRRVPAADTVKVSGESYTVLETIPAGHKMALRAISAGEPVIKYGYPIGHAQKDISPGEWVHTHNLRSGLEEARRYEYRPNLQKVQRGNAGERFFEGYSRSDGAVGVRNEIWILTTVGCCNGVAENLCRLAAERFKERKIDGVFQFSHPYGCSQLGGDLLNTQKILAGLARHPNAGGILVVGLGCENNHVDAFREVLGPYDPARVKFLNIQDIEDEISAGLSLLDELVESAEADKRETAPISKLIVGLKCGGSDAFSGITANPLLGEVSDRLVRAGAAVVLTEVPEMFGAETILMERSESKEIFNKIVDLITGFKSYFIEHEKKVYENPSPGNLEGGITTLEEKSLGCIRKGGSGNITGVIAYGERASRPGLNLLEAPGNDIVSLTALAAAGAQVALFTTGRGTPLGGVIPTLKVASNSPLAQRKNNWIDFDAGRLLEGHSMEEPAEQLFEYIINIASGRQKTKNEISNNRQIAIFKTGVTL